MKKASYSPLILIAIFFVLGGTLLVSTNKLNSGFTSITGFGIFDPVVSNVLVNSTHATNRTGDNLTVYWTSTDDDGERVVNITDWRVDGASFARKYVTFEFDGYRNATDYTTYNQTPTFFRSGLGNISWSPGYGGGRALRLYGKLSSYVNYTASSVTNITGNKLTIMAWVNISEASSYNFIASTNYPSDSQCAGGGGYILFALGSELYFDFTTSTSFYRIQRQGIATDGWKHVAAVYNGVNVSLFMNGSRIGASQAATGNILSAPCSFVIGGRINNDGNTHFNGSIDDVRLYARALSHEQIRGFARNRTDLIVSQETTAGELWSVCITPNDGTTDGAKVCSNNVTIIPPGIYAINTSNPTNQSIMVRWNTTGLANATVNYGLTQGLGSKASSSIFAHNRTIAVTGLKNNTLYYYNVTSFDRYGHFDINGTFNFMTSQSQFPPSTTGATVTSTSGNNDGDDNLTATWTSSDANGDEIVNITDWRLNGTSILILNMPFEANGTTNASDYSTTKKHATPANGPIWNATGGFDGSGAYYFDGANDMITLPSVSLTNTHTVSMWIHPIASSDNYGNLFSEADGEVGLWYRGGTRRLTYYYSSADHLSTTELTESTWSHIVVQVNSGDVSFYINGVKDASTYSGAVAYIAERIGDDATSSNFKGFIDEVKVYNRSLSAEQITALYRNRTDLIVSNETRIGDRWSVAVTPNDGMTNGQKSLSSNITIIDYVAPTPPPSGNGGSGGGSTPPAMCVPSYSCSLGDCQTTGYCTPRYCKQTVRTFLGSYTYSYVCGETCYESSFQTKTCGDGCSSSTVTTQACGLCSNVCTSGSKRCAGLSGGVETTQTCGDYNYDGCTDWGGTSSCSAGDTCNSGICVTPPPLCIPSYSCTTSSCQTQTTCTRYCDGFFECGFGGRRCMNYGTTSTQTQTCTDGCTAPTVVQQSCTPVTSPLVPPPTLPPPTLPPPIETLATIPTSITVEDVESYSLSCPVVNKVEVTREAIKTADALIFANKIEPGFVPVINAFSVQCENNEFELSFAIPDNFEDIQAMSCRGDSCFPIKTTKIEKLNCGDEFFRDVSRTTEYLEPDFFPIPVVKLQTKPGEDNLESSSNKIKFTGDVKGSVSIEPATERVKEAENPGIKIVGTPIVLTFSENNENLATEITLPYVVKDNIDEFSVAIYARSNDKWNYLGGLVNTTSKTVTTDVKNISQYSENNKVTLAVMGVTCLNCLDSEFKMVYGGKSRDAVILVHGFENSPERFEDILNDIRLTNQPWQAWTFGYPSSRSIDDNAKEFADHLQARSLEYDYIYVAAHSMGGIITQQMLRYAYDENKKNPGVYSFLDKIKKVILIAAPNKGAVNQGVYEDLFNVLLNSRSVQGLFSLNNAVLKDLIEGRIVERIPGVEYYVIAGTKSFEFVNSDLTNDGLVAVESAQAIGDELISNKCENYWELDTTHTGILNDFDSRKIVERIIAKEIAESLPSKSVMGYNQYFSLSVDDCSPDDKFILVGKPIDEKETASPGLCACGNNICGVDETELSCPSDCAVIESPKSSLLDLLLHFAPLRNLSIGLLVIITLLVSISRRKHRLSIPKIINYDAVSEKKLNNLLVQTRVLLRTGKLDNAAITYSKFSHEYGQASTKLKEKFKDVSVKLRDETRRKMT